MPLGEHGQAFGTDGVPFDAVAQIPLAPFLCAKVTAAKPFLLHRFTSLWFSLSKGNRRRKPKNAYALPVFAVYYTICVVVKGNNSARQRLSFFSP
jgi:hypothetical protein